MNKYQQNYSGLIIAKKGGEGWNLDPFLGAT